MTQRSGVVTAFVKEVDAKQGRIKVDYQGMEEGLLSPWAYIAAPLSGKSRGALFMPEKGDEVLITYADGHFEHPYVVGFLWNGDQTSPETEAHNRVIVTPGGHQLRFEDKENDTRVILRSNGKHSITLEDKSSGPQVRIVTNGNREVLLDDTPSGGKIRLKSGSHEITMDDSPGGPAVTVQAGQGLGVTIVMKSQPPSLDITVGAGNQLSIDSTGAVSLTCTNSLSITVPAAADLMIGGVANITCSTANITAGATNITSGVLNVTSGLATFSGVLQASAVIAGAISSPVYTPGLGNFI